MEYKLETFQYLAVFNHRLCLDYSFGAFSIADIIMYGAADYVPI
jgi:hypothetical protein